MNEEDGATPVGNDSPNATATLLRLLVGGAVEGTHQGEAYGTEAGDEGRGAG